MEPLLWSLLTELANAIGKEPKLGFLIVAFLFGIPSFVVYLIDEVWGDTEPHPITFLIWFITQVVAMLGFWVGDGGYGAVYPVFYCFCIFSIFVVTLLKYGIKEVNRDDVWSLSICLVAVAIWVISNTPLLSVVIVTMVDGYGFKPTFRKSYRKPWSESMWGWGLSIPNVIFTALAMEKYNPLTLTYPIVMIVLTTALVFLCLVRRRSIPRRTL